MPTTYTPEEREQLLRRAEERYGLPPGEPADPAHRRRSYPANLMPKRSGGGAGGGRSTEERIDLKAIEACWALYRCFTVRADGMAGLPVKLWQGRGEDASEITAGPAWELFDRPNPHWSLARLLGMTEWSLNTSRRGAFWILDAFDGQGRPTEIWWADPRTVRPVRGTPTDDPENQYISHYEVAQPGGAGGKAKRFEREQVVWFQSPHPFSEFESFPSLLAAIESAGLALSSLYANRMLHETGMTGAGYVVPEEGVVWDDDQREEVAGMFATTVKGKSGWHRVMVASRRDFEVRDLQALSPRDVQFAQLMKLTTEQVCIASGVPLPLIQPTDATFSNVDGSISILWSLSLIPRSQLIAGAIKAQLIDTHFAGEVDQVELWPGDIPQLQDDAAAKWNLDQSQLGAMLDLADRVARGYERAAALKAAVFYVGCPEDVAEVIIPAARQVEAGEVVDAARVIELPPLTDLRLLLSAVGEGSLSRDSAIAILEVTTGSRETAEAIVADMGTGIDTAPVSEIVEARAVVTSVVRGELTRASGIALLTRLFGDPTAATAVVADAQPMLALPAGDSGDGDETVATPTSTNGTRPPAPALPARTTILYRGGHGYRVLPTGDTEPLASNGHADAAEGEHRDEDEGDVRIYGSEAHRRAWQDEVDKIEERSGPIQGIVEGLFGGQHREVERGLDGLSEADLARIVEETSVDLDDPSDADMEALAGALALAVLGRAFVPRWIERGLTAMHGGLTGLAGVVAPDTADALGLEVDIDLDADSPMTRMLLARAGRFAEQTTTTSWLRVGQVLARGVRDGGGMLNLARRVEALGEEWKGARALTVAWTEVHGASQAVATEVVRASGVAAQRTWLSALDARVRDDHRDAHGQTVPMDAPFIVGGEECDAPGDCPSASNTVNCRCVQTWAVD